MMKANVTIMRETSSSVARVVRSELTNMRQRSSAMAASCARRAKGARFSHDSLATIH